MGKKSLKLLKKQDKSIGLINAFTTAVSPKVVVLLLSVVLFSCSDRAPVNEQYLETETYKQFSKNQQNEYTTRLKNLQSLKKYLTEFAECNTEQELSFPVQFDGSILEREHNACEQVAEKVNRNFTSQRIGYSKWQDIVIRWILLQKESVYEDAELLAATYRGNTLIGFQTVGVFRQNLQQNFSTDIEVAQDRDQIVIKSAVDRGIKYPFEQNNVIETVYQVDTSGTIVEQTDQKTSYQSLPKILNDLNRCAMGKRWMLPAQINEVTLNKEGVSCAKVGSKYNGNFIARSVGYTIFKDLTVRLFDMRSRLHPENHLTMAGTYKDEALVSFQTVGKFHNYSPNFITDIDISSNVRIHQDGDSLYIISNVIRDRSFPVKQQDLITANYVLGADGNIREI
ncbi:hypothetical protein [Fodinibius sp. SL11]|uniref:hypothetical protein n=1 Tax=Fodinibius sp. SL11 TaxID=3425690 RepID=UPI003F885B4C